MSSTGQSCLLAFFNVLLLWFDSHKCLIPEAEQSYFGRQLRLYDNNGFNLLRQMVIEHKMLWQIKNNYKSDSAACPECHEFWEKLEKETEQRVARLETLIKKYT